jgi:hypothetical protein
MHAASAFAEPVRRLVQRAGPLMQRCAVLMRFGSTYAAGMLLIESMGGQRGLGEVIAMQQVVENLGSSMRLLVASIRSTKELVTLATQARHRLHSSVLYKVDSR